MNIQKIKEQIAEIEDSDSESAHAEEDMLYTKFVEHVSLYPNDLDLREMALEVLKTKSMDFDRWYA